MKQFLINTGIVLAALLFSLLLGEALLRGQCCLSLNYDFEMWRYAAELKEPLPHGALPFHHKANRIGNYYGVEVRTNSFGLRDDDYSVPKQPGRKRIVFLGDSFTFGWGVPQADTYAKQLEKMMRQAGKTDEVINMGVGNYNSAMEVELFKLKGLKLEPDMVVLMYYINDVEPTPRINGASYHVLKHFYLPAYVNTKVKQLGMRNSHKDWLTWYYRSIYAPESEGMKKSGEALRELVRICKERKIKLLLVNIPDLRRLENYPFDFATAHIRGFASEQQLPFLDLLPVFSPYEGKSLWVSPEDSHMNAKANTLAAEALFKKITGDDLSGGR